MKGKLAVLGTAIMAAAAITASLRQGCQDHYSGRGGNTGRHHSRDDGWGDRGRRRCFGL